MFGEGCKQSNAFHVIPKEYSTRDLHDEGRGKISLFG